MTGVTLGSTAARPVDRLLGLVRFEARPRQDQPNAAALIFATVVAVAGSLVADWLLAKLAVAVFPSTKGYQHFQFSDYSKLTIIGILGAAVGWPIVTRFCSTPRWLYLRLAVLVSVVLLLPDLWIWLQGQSGQAVVFLAFMHIAVAVVSYNAIVRIAPAQLSRDGSAHRLAYRHLPRLTQGGDTLSVAPNQAAPFGQPDPL